MEIKLSCKDFDSWVSFLGRLDKLGGGYIIKNDISKQQKKKIMKNTLN